MSCRADPPICGAPCGSGSGTSTTTAVDRETARHCVELMRDPAKRQGCAILFVTHDSRIHDIADHVLRIEDGRLRPL